MNQSIKITLTVSAHQYAAFLDAAADEHLEMTVWMIRTLLERAGAPPRPAPHPNKPVLTGQEV